MGEYQYPFRGAIRVTCPFGKKGNWTAGWHIGTDMVGEEDQKVYAIAAGVVQSVNAKSRSYGKHVLVAHNDGTVSLYAHLADVYVKKDDEVTLDTVLGIMGSSGNATGVHLHLEVHKDYYRYPPRGSAQAQCHWLIDPLEWLQKKTSIVREIQKPQQLSIEKDGQEFTVWAVNIDGNNFVKLRDLEKLFPITVRYVGKPLVEKRE